jgi:hypothetical protein
MPVVLAKEVSLVFLSIRSRRRWTGFVIALLVAVVLLIVVIALARAG